MTHTVPGQPETSPTAHINRGIGFSNRIETVSHSETNQDMFSQGILCVIMLSYLKSDNWERRDLRQSISKSKVIGSILEKINWHTRITYSDYRKVGKK